MTWKIFLFAFIANSIHELISRFIMNYTPNPYDRLMAFIIFCYVGREILRD